MMRAMILIGAMIWAGAAGAQGAQNSWTCTAQDMRVCGPDGKCTKAESRQSFNITGNADGGSVEFCAAKSECRSFGDITVEPDVDGLILRGRTAGFTGFISTRMAFQASGRLRSGKTNYTYAAAGKCRASADFAAARPAPVMPDIEKPKGDFGVGLKSFMAAALADTSLQLRDRGCGKNEERDYCLASDAKNKTRIVAEQNASGIVNRVLLSLPSAQWAESGRVLDRLQDHLLLPVGRRLRGGDMTEAAKIIPGLPLPHRASGIVCVAGITKEAPADVTVACIPG